MIIIEDATTPEEIIELLVQECATDQEPFALQLKFAPEAASEARTIALNRVFTYLNIYHQDITERLIGLDLSHNELLLVPDISSLENLQFLKLSYNKLHEAPMLSENTRLITLNLEHNQLIEPPLLCGLKQLERVYLQNNHLVYAPSVQNLSKLKLLALDQNDLKHPVIVPFCSEESLQVTGVALANIRRESNCTLQRAQDRWLDVYEQKETEGCQPAPKKRCLRSWTEKRAAKKVRFSGFDKVFCYPLGYEKIDSQH